MTRRRVVLPGVLCLLGLLPACSWLSDVSSNMRIDTGLEPGNVDSNVRFRATYYFRVLSGCSLEPSHDQSDDSGFMRHVRGGFVPMQDSLYRFRMTGQAAALFKHVHFESGVLRKDQIDPFGSQVRYHEGTKSFALVSADEVRAESKQATALQDVKKFRDLYRDIGDDKKLGDAAKTKLLNKLVEMIEDRLEMMKLLHVVSAPPSDGKTPDGNNSMSNPPKTMPPSDDPAEKIKQLEAELKKAQEDVAKAKEDAKKHEIQTLEELEKKIEEKLKELGAAAASPQGAACAGKPSEQRYFVLGPEGAKELDPNDRLLMALSVDSKPLIGALQQMSDRRFQTASTQVHTMEALLEERGTILTGQQDLLDVSRKVDQGTAENEKTLALLRDRLRASYVKSQRKVQP
ncbi:MAG: hypothetical protein IT389_04655 [Nitrospira sp.]|nr:hypothetical protein [Nitrospira sp.]